MHFSHFYICVRFAPGNAAPSSAGRARISYPANTLWSLTRWHHDTSRCCFPLLPHNYRGKAITSRMDSCFLSFFSLFFFFFLLSHPTVFQILAFPSLRPQLPADGSEVRLDRHSFFGGPHDLQPPITEELCPPAVEMATLRRGLMRADGRAECFMEPTVMAEQEPEVVGRNYLVLRLRVIKSRERPPGITAG